MSVPQDTDDTRSGRKGGDGGTLAVMRKQRVLYGTAVCGGRGSRCVWSAVALSSHDRYHEDLDSLNLVTESL